MFESKETVDDIKDDVISEELRSRLDVVDRGNFSEQYQESIDSVESQVAPLLDDFKKYYVFYKKNPDYSEYKTIFHNTVSQIDVLYKELKTLDRDIEGDIERLTGLTVVLDDLIRLETIRKEALEDELTLLEQRSSSFSTMYKDTKDDYKSETYYYYSYLFGIVVIILFSARLVSKKY